MKILYLCPDAGVPVQGHKGAAVHVRELVAAFARAGHNVILAAPVLNKSPWEKPQAVAGNVLHLRLSTAAQSAVLAAKDFTETAGRGIKAQVEGEPVLVGRAQWLKDNGIKDDCTATCDYSQICRISQSRSTAKEKTWQLNLPTVD